MTTQVARVDVLVTADARNLPRQVRQISRRMGREFGQEMGQNLSSSLDSELSDWGNNRLTLMRERFAREGKSSGRIFGTTLRQASDGQIRQWLDGIVDDMAKVFTFDGNDGFQRWAKGFDSVAAASERMSKNIRIATEEGRINASTADALNYRLREYVLRAREVEVADQRLIGAKRTLSTHIDIIDRQMSSRSAFRRYTRQVGDLDRAYESLNQRIEGAGRNGAGQRWLDRTRLKLLDLFEAAKKAESGVGNLEGSFNRNGRLMNSHIAKTVAAWTVLVLAIGEATATLGSGVGASLTALISSLAVGIVGLAGVAGAAVGGFAVQIALAVSALQRMKDAVPEVQSAVDRLSEAWNNAGTRFAEIWGPSVGRILDTLTGFLSNTALVEAMATSLGQITDAFNGALNGPGFAMFLDALTNVIPGALTNLGQGFSQILGGLASVFAAASPALATFAGQFNQFWSEWSYRMNEAAQDGSLQEFFEKALDSVNAVLGAVGALGGALWTVFQAGADTGNSMLRTLERLFDQWNDWMNSVEGQRVLEEWFSNGERIFNALLDLAGDLGKVLGELVTPDSVDRLVRFTDALGDALPFAGQLLELLGGLDVLGIVAQAFATIGTLLKPVLEVLTPIAEAIGTTVHFFMGLVQVLYSLLEPLLIPMRVAWEIFNAVIERTVEYLQPIIDKFSEVTASGQTLGDQIIDDLMPSIQELLDAFFDLLPPQEDIVAFIQNNVVPAFQQVTDFILNRIVPAIKDFIDWIKRVVDALGGWDGIKDKVDAVGRVFEGFRRVVEFALNPVKSLIEAVSSAIDRLNGKSISVPSETRANGKVRAAASGALLRRPEFLLAGEAGPEMIVPLARPLGQIDPAVRDVAAYAQGKSAPAASSPSKVVTVGDITVVEAVDGEHTAAEVYRKVVEAAVG